MLVIDWTTIGLRAADFHTANTDRYRLPARRSRHIPPESLILAGSPPCYDVSKPMSTEDLQAELDRLRAENEALKTNRPAKGAISIKVSEKGAVSVYGLGRFPVTLYKEQWDRLLLSGEDIRKFIAENDDKLKKKEG